MKKKTLIALMVVGMFLLAGCSKDEIEINSWRDKDVKVNESITYTPGEENEDGEEKEDTTEDSKDAVDTKDIKEDTRDVKEDEESKDILNFEQEN